MNRATFATSILYLIFFSIRCPNVRPISAASLSFSCAQWTAMERDRESGKRRSSVEHAKRALHRAERTQTRELHTVVSGPLTGACRTSLSGRSERWLRLLNLCALLSANLAAMM